MLAIFDVALAWTLPHCARCGGVEAPLRAFGRASRLARAGAPAMTTQPLVLLAEEEGASSSAVSVVDTLLDVAVYALLLGVVVLTLYSLSVTLDQRNKEYGGWVKKEDDELLDTSAARGPNDRLRSGAVYDPVTEQWTYPAKTTKAAARVGRAPAADEEVGGNRYERRMEKKLKAAREGKKRRS
jgi:hypothetical protein